MFQTVSRLLPEVPLILVTAVATHLVMSWRVRLFHIAAKSFCGDGNRKCVVVLRARLFRQGISRRGIAASKVCVL